MNRLFKGNHAMVSQSQAIYTQIRQNTRVTRQFLSRQLSLPATTVNRALERLLRSGLIAESGVADSTGGRRPNLYQTVGPSFYLLGLNLNHGASLLAITDLHLEIVATKILPGSDELLTGEPAEKLAEECLTLIRQAGLPPEKILGLGISRSVPDTCNEEDRDKSVDSLPAIASRTSDKLGFPVLLIDIRKAAYFAARWHEARQTSHSMLELSVGQNIELRFTSHSLFESSGSPTEKAGRLIIPAPDKMAGTGTLLAQIATVPAMVQRFQRVKDNPALVWDDFCQAVQSGKRKANQVLLDAAVGLAISVVNAALLTGSDLLLLDGQALLDLPEFETVIQSQIDEMAAKAGIQLEIAIKTAENNYPVMGAAALVLDHFLGYPVCPG